MELNVSPKAREEQALRTILAWVKDFYADQEKVKALEAWAKENNEEVPT